MFFQDDGVSLPPNIGVWHPFGLPPHNLVVAKYLTEIWHYILSHTFKADYREVDSSVRSGYVFANYQDLVQVVVVTKEKKPIIETSSNRKEGTTARHSSPHLLHNHVFQYFHFLPIISSQRYRFSKAIKKSEKKAHMQHEEVGHGIGSTECHTLFMGEMMLERGTKKVENNI